MRNDEDEIFEALLGIPDVHVISLEENEAGLRVVVETATEEARCLQCSRPAVAAGRRVVELDSEKPFFGRSMHLVWQTRGWSCPNPDCPTDTFFEEASWRFSAA
jgi:transposase